jgi:tRNA (cytidine/uridine-2'-O-)-methyltransferase
MNPISRRIPGRFCGCAPASASRPTSSSRRAAPLSYLDYRYAADDVLLFGRESAGVPEQVHAAADARVVIPMRPGLRSLNVAVVAAMAAGEALRQVGHAGSAPS